MGSSPKKDIVCVTKELVLGNALNFPIFSFRLIFNFKWGNKYISDKITLIFNLIILI